MPRYIRYNRSIITTIRKTGNGFIIRVPREEVEKAGVQAGQPVQVEIRPVEIRPKVAPRLEGSNAGPPAAVT